MRDQPTLQRLIADREACRETSDADLVEARENMDAGLRLAFPMLAEQRRPQVADPEPEPVAAEAIQRTGTDLLDIRAALMVSAGRFPLEGNEEIHGWINALINGTDSLAALLSERSPS